MAAMTAVSSDHLELSARLSSRHRRRHAALPRRTRRIRWGTHSVSGRRGRGRAFLTGVDIRWQRSTVKASYSKNGRGASWAAHGTYLAREGAQREGGKGRGFSAEQEAINLSRTLRGWQRSGDARLWKFIVSPEHADRLDLKAHTRALVSHIERDLGTRLEWVAIDHHNTDNPHVHLLVRGRDARGQALQIHPDYVKDGIRRRSQDLATQVLGYRSEREIVESRGRAVERLRFTDLDRALLRHSGARGLVTIDGPVPKAAAARAFRKQELRRLQVLEGLGLAEKVWTRTWRLSPQLEPALRQAQLSGDIIKARARHQASLSDPRLPMTITRIEAGTVITGRVVGTGLADELRDKRYLLIESQDRLHYVPQPPAIERARGRGELRAGDIVKLEGHSIDRRGRAMVETRVQVLQPAQTTTGRDGSRPERVPEPARLPTLTAISRSEGRPVTVAEPIIGAIYRGRLVGYGRDRAGHRHAVVDTGRELTAFRTDHTAATPGRDVTVQTREHEDDRKRTSLVWRLGEDERDQERERGR
jgi:type IV secretory pathway VirD2 relaxase